MQKKLTVLGSTGSIGRQTLEVVRQFPDHFQITALASGSNLELLLEQAREFKPRYLAIGKPELYPALKEVVSGVNIWEGNCPEITAGIEGLVEIAILPEVDMVLNAVVGAVGIRPTLAAINAGKDIALANKETLVVAGSVIMPAVSSRNVRLLPVDSEHSAIFQCLEGRDNKHISRLILTASGGPFRLWEPEDLHQVTITQAMAHPNWRMGGKITIDSATMFNKGLEIIEANWLFNMAYDQISVVIHPESIVHSMVELKDGSIIAQMGCCDMRLPIQLALTYPERFENSFPRLDLTKGISLNFQAVNPRLFPAVDLAYAAGRAGGSLPAALNAANEEAVDAFLRERIKFTDIIRVVGDVMEAHQRSGYSSNPGLDEILSVDDWARKAAQERF